MKHYKSSISYFLYKTLQKYLLSVALATTLLFVIIILFFLTRGSVPYTSELNYMEFSSLGKNAGSVIPASCNSADPMALTYIDPVYGSVFSGSHFYGDCLTPCPAPNQATMYDPYFDPSQSVCPVKTANIQVWFTAGTLTPNNCIAPWGIIVPHTSSVTAYSVTSGTTCPSQSRVCTNGSLSGTYMNQTCTVTAPTPTPVGDVGACFVAGTQVLMANGTYKKIETVGSSDFLMSSQGPERVMKRYHIPYKGLVYAFNGDGHYFVTPTHPFMTTEGWKSLDPAGTRRESPGIKVTKLEIGDSLVLLGNTTKVLTQLDSKEISTTVYNFGVNGTHDFYADNYLVHNVDMYFIERVHAGTNLTK